MARPRGYRLNPHALRDMLVVRRLSMTEAADRAGVKLTTLSGLANGDHRASLTTVRALEDVLQCSAELLFPELSGRFVESEPTKVEAEPVAS